VIDDVRKALGDGRLQREDLELRLEAEDLRAIDEDVQVARWYAIATHQRLLAELARVEATGSAADYWIARGARAADRIMALGLYRQLELTSDQFGTRTGNLIVTFSANIYNFGRWVYVSESDDGIVRFRIEISAAEDFPEAAVYTSLGFIQELSRRVTNRPVTLTPDRPRRDLVIYRATVG
jgi:hypothetical protein